MNEKTLQMRLGLGALLVALLFIFIAIPNWVSAPSNIQNVFLSPLFWPYTLAVLTGIVGLGLIAASLRLPSNTEALHEPVEKPMVAMLRMVAIALIMMTSMFLFSRLGMVWTSMLAFLATAFSGQDPATQKRHSFAHWSFPWCFTPSLPMWQASPFPKAIL